MNKKTVIAVVGPTASGKTGLSIELSKIFGGEVVSADSMQVYKNMDIATAKPTEEEKDGIKHHLIGVAEPTEEFSVARFKDEAIKAIEDIFKRNKQPILCGGTGFYVDTLVNNTTFFDFDKGETRAELSKRLKKDGIVALFEELKSVDPESAKRLHINDNKRILRALEVFYSTGKTLTEQTELSHEEESEYNWVIIGLTAENRQLLYDRINLRVDLMVESGLLKETEDFFNRENSSTSKQAIGYKELKPFFDGEISLEDALENLKRETRRYAKRQLTWFKRNEKINWIYIDNKSKPEITEEAKKIIEKNIGE